MSMSSPEQNLFIHPENQTLLWNLIQESPYWRYFSISVDAQQWFRGIISSMYELHPSVKTLDELKRLNGEVVSICSKHMKSHTQSSPMNPKVNKTDFQEFQDRYNAGLAKPQPPVLNLGINLDEPKITNMEELVKQHLESRNTLKVSGWDPTETNSVFVNKQI